MNLDSTMGSILMAQRADDTFLSSVMSWARFALGGLVAGLVAWGGLSADIATLRIGLQSANDRAIEDRQMLRENVRELSAEIAQLRRELAMEREERLRDERSRSSSVPSSLRYQGPITHQ